MSRYIDSIGHLLVTYPVHFTGSNIDHHLKGYENTATETIRENIYVDNVITGKDTVKEAVDFYTKAKQIFRKTSMNMRDWMSNDEPVMKEIPVDDRAKHGPMKILDLTWVIEDDMIGLNNEVMSFQI